MNFEVQFMKVSLIMKRSNFNPLKLEKLHTDNAIFFLNLIELCDVTDMTKCSRQSVANMASQGG